MRVLICGGRDFTDWPWAFEKLDRFLKGNPVHTVVHGDAVGADRIAGQWADARGLVVEKFPADWSRLGNAAGPARNAKMLREGKPDAVFVLPGGRGTANMVMQAKEAGVPITFAKGL
jgi:hypothetical protein